MTSARTSSKTMMQVFRTLTCTLALVSGVARAQQPGSSAIKVTLLGTGDPVPLPDRFGPSILVQAGGRTLLFDAGRGATIRLQQLGVPWSDVRTIFLTHLHSDHVGGFPDLMLTSWLLGREVPLRVWGPDGTKAMVSHLVDAFTFDISIRETDDLRPAEGAIVEATDIKQGIVYDEGGVKVMAFNVDHGPVKPAFGYRIDYGGHAVVLSGDTRPSDNLVRFAQGADLLIHEVAYMDPKMLQGSKRLQRIMAHHSSPSEAGQIFSRVKPKLVVYSHFTMRGMTMDGVVAETRRTYTGPLEIGQDLMTIEVGQQVRVTRPH
jgi:ribonuclease Z